MVIWGYFASTLLGYHGTFMVNSLAHVLGRRRFPTRDNAKPVASFRPRSRLWSAPVRLGMPQLALAGLSESWLLMECGHRHWTLLERMLGVEARHMWCIFGRPP